MNRREFFVAAGGAMILPPVLRSEPCTTETRCSDWNWERNQQACTPSRQRDFNNCTPTFIAKAKRPFDAIPRDGEKPIEFVPPACASPIARPLWSKLQLAKNKRSATKVSDDLKRAYDEIIRRKDNDPASMFYQAWLHRFSCSSAAGGIHGTWDFLPWHRAFLYFHERILAKACGKPEFRLPVWDWENKVDLPRVYEDIGLPSFAQPVSRGPVKLGASNYFTDCKLRGWLHSDTFEDFCGSSGGRCAPGASTGPHLAGHQSVVGGPMNDPDVAAADPLFFAHHANIDRFWSYWLSHYTSFAKPGDWLAREYFFYDEHQNAVRIHAWQLLYEEHLGYSYPERPNVALDLDCRRITPEMWANPRELLATQQKLAVGTLEATGRYSSNELTSFLGSIRSGNEDARLPMLPIKIRAELSGLTPGVSYTAFVSGGNGPAVPVGNFSVLHHDHGGSPPCVPILACADTNLHTLLGGTTPGNLKLSYGTSLEDRREIPFTNDKDNLVVKFEVIHARGAYEAGDQLVSSHP